MMSVDTLATELEVMVPAPDEATGINNFSNAWTNYFFESSVSGISPLDIGLLTPAKEAMRTAMIGVSQTGPASISAGIAAFWGIVATSAVTIWVVVPPLASATPPTGLGGMAAAIAAAGTANIAAQLSLEDSVAAIAAAIHPLNLGGLAINTAPIPVSIPIL